MKPLFVLAILILTAVLAACNLASYNAAPTLTPSNAATLEFVQPIPAQPATVPPISPPVAILPTPLSNTQAVLDRASQVVAALKGKEMTALSSYVSPQLGLRFSPYAAVKDTDQVFPADKVAGLFSDSTIYTWGAYSGSGESIDLTFADYYAKFIYDEDFVNAPELSVNHRLGEGTTLDNAAKFYPGSMIVEYFFPGFDLSLEGMDWRSLRLVFMQEGNTWYLAGIIHDQWTT